MRTRFAILIICVLVITVSVFSGCSAESDTGGNGENAASDGSDNSSALGMPEIEPFLGGWGAIDDGSELEIVFVYEENNKLKIEFGAIPGGGVIASFDPDNLEVKSASLTCCEGEILTEGGTLLNAKVTAEPAKDGSGRYKFDLTADGKNILGGEVFSYDKVADTRKELDKWIEDNDPL